jgi:hypothetical protein
MFEPFGLLNFIKNALQSTATPPQNSTEFQTPPTPNVDTPPPPQQENPVQTSPQNLAQTQDGQEKFNPFLSFCDEHDRRSKRIKRGK